MVSRLEHALNSTSTTVDASGYMIGERQKQLIGLEPNLEPFVATFGARVAAAIAVSWFSFLPSRTNPIVDRN